MSPACLPRPFLSSSGTKLTLSPSLSEEIPAASSAVAWTNTSLSPPSDWMATVEAPPGAVLPWHFHYGEEAVYVLQGAMVETVDGKQQMSETGSAYINVREVPHGGYKVIGNMPLKVLTIHIVDKGKQMTWPIARAP
jgi:quercetin dioxygenase-like cupin family protein